MTNLTLVILCAGSSNRFEFDTKKQWLRVDNIPLWLNVARNFLNSGKFKEIIITSSNEDIKYMRKFDNRFKYTQGGATREQSIKNALNFVDSKYVMITDVARCCIPNKIINNLIKNRKKADIIVPYLKIADTVVYNSKTIDRDNIKIIQTPQLSKTKILKKALMQNGNFTDDSGAIKNIGGTVFYIKGSKKSEKLTFKDNLNSLKCLKEPSNDIFIGNGLDIHPFEDNKIMYLGGVKIDANYGFKAHSDGDVLIHSLIDSLLGAIGAGDIGEFFPDTDEKYKNIDSKILLKEIVTFIKKVGFQIINIDISIIAQQPKINPYKDVIKKSLANILEIELFNINIKATTAEKLGFIGRKEGVAVISSSSLKYFNWTKI